MMNKWILVNQSTRPTRTGTALTESALTLIAWAVEEQVNKDFAPSCGGEPCTVRVSDGTDLALDERVLTFVDTFPAAPTPNTDYCDVTTCVDLFGPSGVSVDVSHLILEDAGNPNCCLTVDDGRGREHEWERCDPVETQTYVKVHPSGQAVCVSNFLLNAWVDPTSRGPFTYMASKGVPGYTEPAGPFKSAVGGFQLSYPSGSSSVTRVFGKDKLSDLIIRNHMSVIKGFPRKRNGAMHWSSRPSRIIAARNSRIQALIASAAP